MVTDYSINKRFGFLCLLLFAFTLITIHSFAGTQLWDFKNDAEGWKVANGNWSVTDGIYQLQKGGQAEHSLVGEEDWDDYTIEAKVRLDAGDWGGLVFRAQSEHEYYVYYLNVPNNKTELWKHTKPNWDSRQNLNQIPAVGGVKIENGEWLEMKIEVQGDTFTYYINDEMQSEDSNGDYGNGQVGVWGWQTGVSFDDFTVTGKNIVDTLDVNAKSKLTTTWSSLKQSL